MPARLLTSRLTRRLFICLIMAVLCVFCLQDNSLIRLVQSVEASVTTSRHGQPAADLTQAALGAKSIALSGSGAPADTAKTATAAEPILSNAALMLPPALGSYSNSKVTLSGNLTVTPDNQPSGAIHLNVSTDTNFKGTFSADPTTGVVHVTDAHPAGNYTVKVTAFDSGGATTTSTFQLMVQAGVACTNAPTFTGTEIDLGDHTAPRAAAIGDFNGDGKQDLAVGQYFFNLAKVSILLGDGAGNFTSAPTVDVGNTPTSIAVGDFNGDGRQDLAVANETANTVSIRLGDGAGNFSGTTNISAGNSPVSVAVGDFNGDGKQDLAVAAAGSNAVAILMGDGTGNFTSGPDVIPGTTPKSVAVGDFNGDGKQDLAVANVNANTVSIRLGDGAGNFSGTTNVSVGNSPQSVAVGDFNGDGKQDFAAADFNGHIVSIRLGDGAGNFTDSTNITLASSSFPNSIDIGDFDGDGRQDLAIADSNSNTVSIRFGDGTGNFSGTTDVSAGGFFVTIGDFNGDGKQDFASVDSVQNVSIRLEGCNGAPTIVTATGLSRQQGSPSGNSQIASVTDDGGNGNVTVKVNGSTSATVNGVTLSNIVNSGGTVTADIVADCAASNASFTLEASDGVSATNATLNVSVTANTAPVLTYPNPPAIAVNSSTTVAPTAASDNGSITGYAVQSVTPALTTAPSVNASGVVAITGAQPAGTYTITIRATDNCGATTDASFTLTVLAPLSLTVNDTGDTPDNNVGDRTCADAIGKCTLRAALQETNAATLTGNTINFNLPANSTITLLTALPDVNGDLVINGPGANQLTVQRSTAGGTPNFGIFTVNAGKVVTINGLTISNGRAVTGGGISNLGTLTINDSIISGNTTTAGDGAGIKNSIDGGGTATLTINNSTISGNASGNLGGGGGISNVAAGLGSTATVNINNCTISGNTSNGGAGILNSSSNDLSLKGGTARANIVNSTISGNTSGNRGGGIYNVTSGNSGTASAVINSSTITGNKASSPGAGGGIGNFVLTGTATVKLTNTIVASNLVNGTTLDDLSGAVDATSSFNLISSGGSSGLTNGVNNNLVGVTNPLLAPLGNYGGPTQTYALLPGSPAINAGSTAAAPAADQRGVSRVGTADIGAFESRGFSITATSGTPQSTIINSSFPSSLVATVSSAFSEPVEGGLVTFTAPATGPSATFTGGVTSFSTPISAAGQASATASANGTAGGPYNVTASLGTGQPTAIFALTNKKVFTTISVASSVNPSEFGQSVTLTATIIPTQGTGTVTFKDNGTAIPTCTNVAVSSGQATCTTSALTVGLHAITADYSGDATFDTSTGTLAGGQQVNSAVRLSASAYNVSEDGQRVIVTVNRVGDLSNPASVDYATSDPSGLNNCSQVTGNASQRCDYAAVVGTLRFAAGEGSKTISIPLVDDSYAEGAETFTITLSNAAGMSLGSQSTATITINDNETTNGPNPIATTPFFVRQQYIDFLGREPDPIGFQGWQDILNNCPQGSTACDRIEVSSDFFRSPEFQERGYFIYRFYSPVLGRIPHYNEFIPDIAKVSGFLNDQDLETARVAFVQEFMSRTEFKAKYDPTLNDPAGYVHLLEQTAGVTLANEQALITGLQNGTETRATVLRKFIESSEVAAKFFNEAFVVEAYFGYLRRDPDILYLQWVQTVNQTGGYRTLINGFMNSNEYVLRFGP